LDVYLLSFLLSSAIGRIGCHLRGCCHGIHFTWLVLWQGKRHHPQLYSCFVGLCCIIISLNVAGTMTDLREVYFACVASLAYNIERLLSEELRDKDNRRTYLICKHNFSTAQCSALLLVILLVPSLFILEYCSQKTLTPLFIVI